MAEAGAEAGIEARAEARAGEAGERMLGWSGVGCGSGPPPKGCGSGN